MLMLNKFSYRIYYEDTDSGGVVYYANYLKFFERARTDFLREIGINQSELMLKENKCFVVRKCEIEYISPAKLDDLIEVELEIEKINAATIIMNQKITYDNKLLTKLRVELAYVNSNDFKPCRIRHQFS
jgi:acyl-CoA thioester hydrolase